MATSELEKLVNDYIDTWSTTDSKHRQELVEKIYSQTAEFYAEEPGDKAVNHKGTDAIFGNISQVNDRLVIGVKSGESDPLFSAQRGPFFSVQIDPLYSVETDPLLDNGLDWL